MSHSSIRPFFAGLAARIRGGAVRFGALLAFTLAFFALFCCYVFAVFNGRFSAATVERLLLACLWGGVLAPVLRLVCERGGHAGAARWVPWAGGLAAAALALALWLSFPDSQYWTLVYGGVLAAAVFLACWLVYGPDNEATLFAYLLKSAVFCAALSLVIMLGLLLCLAATDALLLSVDTRCYLITAALPWILVLPNLFCACLPRCGAPVSLPKVYHVLLSYVALPVYLLLLAVLYGYILKIVFTLHMPAGTMNWYASFALAACVFFWLGLRTESSRPARLFLRWGWVLLVPVVLVQLVGIAIRLRAYGLTSLRYLGLACLALGLFALGLAALRKGPRPLFVAGAVLALLLTVTPLNLVDVPAFFQAQRLKAVLVRNEMWDGTHLTPAAVPPSAADQAAIASGWSYLRYSTPALYAPDFMAQATGSWGRDGRAFSQIYGFARGEAADALVYESYFLNAASDCVDLTGYTRLYPLEASCTMSPGDGFTLSKQFTDGETLTVDLTDYLQALSRQYDESSDTLLLADQLYPLADGRTLYFTAVHFTLSNGVMDYAYISGYLLAA